MPIIKCKMCGGDLNLVEGATVCECEYCGTKQTVPSADSEKKLTLFARAGRLLRGCEFDKAAGVFESIVADFPDEAEAYWGLVLCKYGIEYVDDPATGKKIPTCHRSSFDNVMKDPNFEQACENTDAVARRVYRDEARAIEELRKSIIEVSGKEEPYDVFISYKETDANGERTPDSVIAQEIYRELTREGYRIFFSRISLENRLGTEYEPYIFAALNSAKVMIVVGTDYENFDSVWVKNEWSRYLKLIAKGEKKTLIPVFRDMDAYDMPEEFNKLTALDMGKIGAVQDLVHGVGKLVGKKKADAAPAQPTQPVYVSGGPNVAAMIERGRQALEDGEWEKADGFFDQALNMDARCAEAFLGKFCAREQAAGFDAALNARLADAALRPGAEQKKLELDAETVRRLNDLKEKFTIPGYLERSTVSKKLMYDLTYPSLVSARTRIEKEETERLNTDRLLSRARRYASGGTAEALSASVQDFEQTLADKVQEAKEQEAQNRRKKREEYAAFLIEAEKELERMYSAAEETREQEYQTACGIQEDAASETDYQQAIRAFENGLIDYKDSGERVEQCRASIEELKTRKLAEEKERERQRREAAEKAAAEEAERKRLAAEKAERERIEREKAAAAARKKRKTITAVAVVLAIAAIAGALLYTKVLLPKQKYDRAEKMLSSGDFEGAYQHFRSMDYQDSAERADKLLQEHWGEVYVNAAPGDVVVFGSYEQDNNTANGAEAIEWQVLARENDRLLVISKYALDCQPYNTKYEAVTWESCSLRSWLNESFLKSAFSSEEQAMIPTVTVSADRNPSYSTDPGKDMKDKVFLLSIKEADNYFSSDEARKSIPTALAKANGCYVSDSGTCWWWLRSPGLIALDAAYVNAGGSVDACGYSVCIDRSAVRPALWIHLGS